MSPSLLDNPLVLNAIFWPRKAPAGTSTLPNVCDGTIPVASDVVLGYRFYLLRPDAPVLLHFHGNGEVASDHDFLAPLYHKAGVSLLVVDYRGYGWSTGKPLLSALLTDAERVVDALPDVLAEHGAAGEKMLVMGRSLGSAPAIHVAHTYPELFRGLIVESGFSYALPLLAQLGVPEGVLLNLPDPIGNLQKVKKLALPLLVIHGPRDVVIPFGNGRALYEASPAEDKRFLRIDGAGHNTLLMRGMDAYFEAVTSFVAAVA